MKIADSCCCGAKFTVEDNNDISAAHHHRHWLIDHRICRQPPLLASTLKPVSVGQENQE